MVFGTNQSVKRRRVCFASFAKSEWSGDARAGEPDRIADQRFRMTGGGDACAGAHFSLVGEAMVLQLDQSE